MNYPARQMGAGNLQTKAGDEAAGDDVERIFWQQKAHQWQVKATTAAERAAKLSRLQQVILDHAAEIGDALYTDLRKPRGDSVAPEVAAVLADIEDAVAHLHEWMQPVSLADAPQFPGGRSSIVYEPRGICLLFGPWNFPFQLVLEPLVPIVAAGNCAIVKPNEMAPATSAVTAKIIRAAFEEREIAVLEGGIDLANRLLDLPVDHIFFTGSPKVGKAVMAAAAKHLASVTLELGGKCPAIVDGSFDLAAAAAQIGTWRCYNSGQLCLSPDHVWIPRQQRDAFLGHLIEHLKASFYPDGTLHKDALGKIVDMRNLERLKGYLADADARGARLVFGGMVEDADRTCHPAVLVDVPQDAAVMQEEIFGPILPVMTYETIDDVIDYLNRRGKPLATYIFSDDKTTVDAILRNTSSGGVTVNGIALHWWDGRLPFGGVNESGIGRYHGFHGFRELSHERAVFQQLGT